MNNFTNRLCAIVLSLTAVKAHSADVDVEVTNLTQNIAFTPLLLVAHNSDFHLFSPGREASPQLQAMAEGGALDGLVSMAEAVDAQTAANFSDGPVLPTASASIMHFDAGDHDYLSLVGMLLPTNDGFVGMNSWAIPSHPGTYTLWLNGYDAGTEANDERVVENGGMPGVPGIPDAPLFEHGTGGSGVALTTANDTVHIHPGNLGDGNPQGGTSDLTNTVHRWLNPVAKVVVTVH